MNSVITFISDYGIGSPYTASMQGSAYTLMPNARVFEVSHHIPSFDLVQTAFILRNVYDSYPKGTVHIICVDTNVSLHKQALFVEYDGHFFVGADNGIFSLLFNDLPSNVYRIINTENGSSDLFPEKNIFLPFVAKFLQKRDLNGLAEPSTITNIKTGINPTLVENGLKGSVMYVDGFQNAITNIHKDMFEKERAERKFRMYYWGKHFIDQIHSQFHSNDAGDDVLLFNSNGFLMIAIHKGKGAQLHGLKPGSKIVIEFENGEGN